MGAVTTTSMAVDITGEVSGRSSSEYPSFPRRLPVWTELAEEAGIDHPILGGMC